MRDKLTIVKDEVKLYDLVDKIIGIHCKNTRPPKTHCPFHNDSDPSLNVYQHRYRCFVCQAQGDAIEFVKQHLKIGFREAVDYLFHEFLGYASLDPKGAYQRLEYHPNAHLPAIIPEMSESFASLEERIAACNLILPLKLVPYFMILERSGHDLMMHMHFPHEVQFRPPHNTLTVMEWIAYWHNIPKDNELECVRIWEQWCMRAETYYRDILAGERFQKIIHLGDPT